MFLGEKRGDEEAVEQISVGVYMYDTKYHKLLYIFFFSLITCRRAAALGITRVLQASTTQRIITVRQ